MTDKQIIIDGVDVSRCIYYKATGKYNTCGYDCELAHNCYYKQLKAKEQELENICKAFDIEYAIDEETGNLIGRCDKLYNKEQECEELRLLNTKLNSALGYRRAGKKTFIDLSIELDQLKAKNDELKMKNSILKDEYKILEDNLDSRTRDFEDVIDGYKQALTEIKEIAEKLTDDYGHEVSNAKIILQKISECEAKQ